MKIMCWTRKIRYQAWPWKTDLTSDHGNKGNIFPASQNHIALELLSQIS